MGGHILEYVFAGQKLSIFNPPAQCKVSVVHVAALRWRRVVTKLWTLYSKICPSCNSVFVWFRHVLVLSWFGVVRFRAFKVGSGKYSKICPPTTVNGFSYSILFGENVFFFVRFVTQGLCFRGSREAQSYTSFFLAISDFGNFVVWSHHPTKSQNALRHHVDTCVQTDRVRGCCDITRMCLRDRSPFLSCLGLTISWFGPIMRQNLKTS